MSNTLPPEECYQHLGFPTFDSQGAFLEAADWKRVVDSKLLADMRQRTIWQRDLGGQPLVDHGFVIGKVPGLRLDGEQVNRLLTALDEGLAAGCRDVGDWQVRKLLKKS